MRAVGKRFVMSENVTAIFLSVGNHLEPLIGVVWIQLATDRLRERRAIEASLKRSLIRRIGWEIAAMNISRWIPLRSRQSKFQDGFVLGVHTC